MKSTSKFLAAATVLSAVLGVFARAHADTLITDFNTFFENELYASWRPDAVPAPTIVSGPDSYSVTAQGYGSNYVYIGDKMLMGAGNTHIQLDVTLSGPPAADGKLGPIIDLIDADGDGTWYTFAWYGQTLGDHRLTMNLLTPTGINNPGTTPGLNLNALTHMHMELDPSGFTSAPYTVEWKNLTLITAGAGDFDASGAVTGYDFLYWQQFYKFLPFSDFKANFGTIYSADAATQGVPEPATGLLCVGAVGLFERLRRKPWRRRIACSH